MEALESRVVPYATSGNVWPHPQLVTISFVPDGTNLGGVSSNLFATFNAKWATNVWQNQILRAAQVWAQQTNLNFSMVSDNGTQLGGGNYQQGDPGMGDIRIGGYNFGSSTLASAYLPPPINNYSVAGDFQFNTGQVFNIGSTYDLFTVAAHEFGHALGLLHSSVAIAEMYASYNRVKWNLNADDISGIKAIYSGARQQDSYDASASNGTFSTASNIQNQINTTKLTALIQNLDITTTSDLDYYTFTAPSGSNSSFKVSVQSNGLSLLGPSVTVYASDQTTVLGSATGTVRTGNTLTLTISGISAGQQFYVKVAGADTTAFATGAYALILNFGNNPTPTVTPPNTRTLNGSPLSNGGGQPDSPGLDVFPDPDAPAQSARVIALPPSADLVSKLMTAGAPTATGFVTPSLPTPTRTARIVAMSSVVGEAGFSAFAALSGGGEATPETLTAEPLEETLPIPLEATAGWIEPLGRSMESVAAPSELRPTAEQCDACFVALGLAEIVRNDAWNTRNSSHSSD